MSDLLHDFPVIVTVPVAWGEMDAFGHVNNIVYFRYFETARMSYFEQIGWTELHRTTGQGPILAETHCRYRAAVAYPDTLQVGARVSDLGTDRLTMEYAIASQKLDKVVAEGTGLIVAYDYHAQQKATLPDAVRQRIEVLQKRDWSGEID